MFTECCSGQLCQELGSNQVYGLRVRIAAAAWTVALIWIGLALLLGVGLGVGLLGVGIIILGEQVARSDFNLKVQWFWVFVGLLFLAGGLWELSGWKLALARQPL